MRSRVTVVSVCVSVCLSVPILTTLVLILDVDKSGQRLNCPYEHAYYVASIYYTLKIKSSLWLDQCTCMCIHSIYKCTLILHAHYKISLIVARHYSLYVAIYT